MVGEKRKNFIAISACITLCVTEIPCFISHMSHESESIRTNEELGGGVLGKVCVGVLRWVLGTPTPFQTTKKLK